MLFRFNMRIKTEAENFYRDDDSNALINTDVNAYAIYKQRRELKSFNSSMEKEMSELKAELEEMKRLLFSMNQQKNKETE